jgi:hypothetical protein
MINLLPTQRAPSSVLGLALTGSRLEGVVLRRSNGSLRVQKTFAASLALNPLTGDPELVGREIRNHLEQAGVRERRCAFCIPLGWALVLQTKVPALPEADVNSFLQIEAERGFPYGPEALAVSDSRCRAGGGEQYATIVAVPRNHLGQLEKALRAAQLRPASFTFGITALQNADEESSGGVLALAIGENSVDLQVTCGGGILALRALEGAIETEGVQKRLYADLLAREIRITLGQLPAEFRESVRKVRVFGRGELVQRFVNDVTPRIESMGLRVELVGAYRADEFSGSQPPPDATVSPALSLAARHLTGARPLFEFLPPKVRPWRQFTTRFSSKKLAWTGATAGTVALLVVGAFLTQQWQLSRLQSQWTAMEPRVKELENLQQQIRKFRPWFDGSFPSLSILRKLTEAFPEDGAVSAKTVEIRNLATVTCSGTARNNQALLQMRDKLSASEGVREVHIEQTRGSAPMQFTFNFHWGEGSGDAN